MTTNSDNLFPWEPAPRSVEETVVLMQQDFAYAVTHTAVKVHSSNPTLEFTVNTHRGQLMPRGVVIFVDGTTIELQDIGMPQVHAQYMTVQQIMARVWKLASDLGLELAK